MERERWLAGADRPHVRGELAARRAQQLDEVVERTVPQRDDVARIDVGHPGGMGREHRRAQVTSEVVAGCERHVRGEVVHGPFGCSRDAASVVDHLREHVRDTIDGREHHVGHLVGIDDGRGGHRGARGMPHKGLSVILVPTTTRGFSWPCS